MWELVCGSKMRVILSELSSHTSGNSSFSTSQVRHAPSQWLSKSKTFQQGLCNNLTADACNTAFHPHLLLSLCGHTVGFYGIWLVPTGYKTSALSLRDALFYVDIKKKIGNTCVCVKSTLSNSALCFPLTVVLQCFSSLSHLPPHPPGWLAAVRQNWIRTSTTTSEHVHTLIHTHTQCHRLCYYCSKMVLQPCYGVNVVGYDGPQPQCTHISAHILSSAMDD